MTNSNNTTFYIGITNNLTRRVEQHKNKTFIDSFTGRYKLKKLVHFEQFLTARSAINREKQLKGGSRKKKIDLIIAVNPDFNDLYDELIRR